MSLLQLPSELICHVAGFSIPEGIEGFALSCRRIYLTCEQQLRQHRQLKQRWHKITVGITPGAETTLHLALELTNDPRVAWYVEDANMLSAAWTELGHDEVWELLDPLTKDKDAISKIRTFLLRTLGSNEYGPGVDLGKWFDRSLTRLDFWCPDMLNILVMALFPNLKHLTPPRCLAQNEQDFMQVLRHVIGQGSMGSCLQVVRPYEYEGEEIVTPLQAMLPLMELQSVEQMYICSAVAADRDLYSFKWDNEQIMSQLVRIELASCSIDTKGLSSLLMHTPLLKSFNYSHEEKWGFSRITMDFGAFVSVIGECIGNTLINLAVTVDEFHGDVLNGVASMEKFLVLETAEFDVRIFGDLRHTAAGDQSIDGMPQQQGKEPPSLAEILPRSIRKLTLFADGLDDNLQSLFDYTPATASRLLPDLEQVLLRYCDFTVLPACISASGAVSDKLESVIDRKAIWRSSFTKRFPC